MIVTEKIMVKISELRLDSKEKINIKCIKCLKMESLPYYLYNKITKNNTEKYYCDKCK